MAQRRHLRSAAGHQLVVLSELMWPSDVFCTRSETVKFFASVVCVSDTSDNTTIFGYSLTFRRPLLPYGYCYKASSARQG